MYDVIPVVDSNVSCTQRCAEGKSNDGVGCSYYSKRQKDIKILLGVKYHWSQACASEPDGEVSTGFEREQIGLGTCVSCSVVEGKYGTLPLP